MIPLVSVPMNFGIQLLSSPTHSTLELKAEDETTVLASSVILSFNSPVINRLTTTLHLTSLDMRDFSEEAVRYFVDAAYTGATPTISRHMFRDINKMAHVYEVSWLGTRCVQHFSNITDTIRTPSFTDLLFIFEEAAFAVSQLKSRQLVQIMFKKIAALNWKRQFIKQYLYNLSDLSKHQLDLIIELAGNEVDLIVQPLVTQLTEHLAFKTEVIAQTDTKAKETGKKVKENDTIMKDASIQTQVTGTQQNDLVAKPKVARKASNEAEHKEGRTRRASTVAEPVPKAAGDTKAKDTKPKDTKSTRSATLPRPAKTTTKEAIAKAVKAKKAASTPLKEALAQCKNAALDPLGTVNLDMKERKVDKQQPNKAESKEEVAGIQPNCRYFLQNCDLSRCQKYHPELFEHLFDVLQNCAAGSQTDLAWLFQVLRKSSKQAVRSCNVDSEEDRYPTTPIRHMLADHRPSLTTAISIEQSEDLCKNVIISSQRVIPNLFQTLNFDQTFDELVDWLGSSQQVTNMLMFLEGLWTWIAVNKDKKIKFSPELMEKIRKIKQARRWRAVFAIYVNFRHNSIYSEQLFDGLKSASNAICGDSELGLEFAVMVEKSHYVSLRSLFLEKGKLAFHYENKGRAKCGEPGKCGFVLTVITSEDGYVSLQLCIDPESYSDTVVHYHDEIRADNMHFIARDKSQTWSFPLSWLGRPRVVDNTVFWGSCRKLLNWADELLFDVLLAL